MVLTAENYYSSEANREYMSVSQFKSFRKCEAAALAELNGEYERETTTALLVGSYVDSYFEGTLDRFKLEHPELFKRDGELEAEYKQADVIIGRIKQDRLFSLLMSGAKQVIKTGNLYGINWKIKIDSLLDADTVKSISDEFPQTDELFEFSDGCIVDLKCMKDLAPIYNRDEGLFEPFVTAWGYDIQGAVYQQIDGNGLPFVIAAATKETPTRICAIYIPSERLEECMTDVARLAPRYDAIKRGKIKPTSCGKCAYCRSKEKLTNIIDYTEVF